MRYAGTVRLVALLLLAVATTGCPSASPGDDVNGLDLDGRVGDGLLELGTDLLAGSSDLAGSDLASLSGGDLLPAFPPYHPFGSGSTYAAGTIFPSEPASARNTAVKAAYDDWKGRYLASGCTADRQVVKYSADPDGLTVSEAHGYGMIIAALMAGHDAEAQTIFDDLYRYYDAHRSPVDLSSFGHTTNLFMSWKQDDQCANTQGASSATDGDIDIAYALLLADAQWGSTGDVDYKARALAIIDQLMDTLVEGSAAATPSYLTIGDWTLGDVAWEKRTRTSDFILAEFRAFRSASADARWDTAIAGMIDIAEALQINHAAASGLLPDFVENAHSSPAPVAPSTLEGPHDGHWYANACRTPWRIGQDAVMSGAAPSKAIVEKMTSFMRTQTGDDPKKICSGYDLAGNALDACDWHALMYIAPFAVAAMVDADHQVWLDGIWAIMKDPSLIGGERQYYGDSINLLAMLVASGNWWQP